MNRRRTIAAGEEISAFEPLAVSGPPGGADPATDAIRDASRENPAEDAVIAPTVLAGVITFVVSVDGVSPDSVESFPSSSSCDRRTGC